MRRDELEGSATFAIGAIDQIHTVEMQHVEQHRRQRQFVPKCVDVESTSEAPHRRLERQRNAGRVECDHFSVEDGRIDRQFANGRYHLR